MPRGIGTPIAIAVCLSVMPTVLAAQPAAGAKRLVILKVDGLNADLLAEAIRAKDPATGKSQLPWLTRIFAQQGTIYENFYTRGISLSAPSWSMLDTGHDAVIRGNAEYDRFTGQVYDYLNFFPFYIGYARKKDADMPGVAVLDRAGIPLLIDHFQYPEVYQSFQLFQRGVSWTTLQQTLKQRFSSKSIISMLEGATPSYDSLLAEQTEIALGKALKDPQILYLDLFTGAIDHEGHATNEAAALLKDLREVDALAGRIWTAIQTSGLADQTILVMVSDHGMNNVPGIVSQTYSLPDLLNSPVGGAHHVVTDRVQMSDFKLKGLDPLVHRVTTASEVSFYLAGEAGRYPTAWLDIDGNERAALHLRNSDLNKIHILLLQLARDNLSAEIRRAAAVSLRETIDKHRAAWAKTASEMDEEMKALKSLIEARRPIVESPPKVTKDGVANGEHRAAWRLRQEFDDWEDEYKAYTAYLARLKRLLGFEPDMRAPLKIKISDLVPEMSLGDPNTFGQLRHYVAGPTSGGLKVAGNGRLDEDASFRYVDYPALFAEQRARNRPQPQLAAKPIDFTAMRLPNPDGAQHAYWLYGDERSQLVILTDAAQRIAVRPVTDMIEDVSGNVTWTEVDWRAGLPLALFEDAELQIPAESDRSAWLRDWHTEKEWFAAIYRTRYSNGVIGIIEELSPVGERVPGRAGIGEVMLRYERRRRELVEADLHLFAADHWNFNVRFPNPGGNHGSFLRISTHSVWMMAGAGIAVEKVQEPADSLSFAATVLALVGKGTDTPPIDSRR